MSGKGKVWIGLASLATLIGTFSISAAKAIYKNTLSDKDFGIQATYPSTSTTTPPPPVEVTWNLVTDNSTLNVDDEVIIAAYSFDYAISTTQNNNNRARASITKNSDNTASFSDDAGVQIITLENGSEENTFAFNVGEESYLTSASSGSNYLKTKNTIDGNSSWLVDITSSGSATAISQGSYTRNSIRYNSNTSGGQIFSCYSSGQQPICFYKKTGGAPISVTRVALSPSTANVTVGGTVELTATVEPANATNKNVYYTTNDETVLSVSSSGVVTGLKAGSATVTVHTEDGGFTANCLVTVTAIIPVTGITISPTTMNLVIGGKGSLTASVQPETATDKKIWYTSQDTSICTVDTNGEIIAIAEGSTVVYATSNDGGFYDYCTVNVSKPPLQSMTLSIDADEIKVGGEATITVNPNPVNAEMVEEKMEWVVTQGEEFIEYLGDHEMCLIQGIGIGTAKIKAVYDGTIESNLITLNVISNVVPVTSVTLNKSSDTMNIGAVQTLTATVLPNDADDRSITWSSSQPSIASVDQNGKVTALAEGTSTITVTSNMVPTIKATCSITVKKGTTVDAYIKINEDQTDWSGTYLLVYESSSVAWTGVDANDCYVDVTISDGQIETKPDDAVELIVESYENGYSAQVNGGANSGKYIYGGSSNCLNFSNDPYELAFSYNGGPKIAYSSSSMQYNTSAHRFRFYTSSQKAISLYKYGGGSHDPISVTGINIDKTSMNVNVGKTGTITASVVPSNATNKQITWTSSNDARATVNGGVVTGVSAGTATITATTVDGNFSKTCTVTITEAPVPVVEKTKMDYSYADYYTHNVYNLSRCPTTGNPKVLIIPIWFTDSSTYIDNAHKETIKTDVGNAYLGSNTDTGWRSVKTYYEELSDGRLNLTGTVADWYSAPNNIAYYGNDANGTSRTSTLVKNATDNYFSTHSSDSRRNYDSDGDGYLDAVICIYGAPDYSTGAYGSSKQTTTIDNYGNLWAYCYWEQQTSYKSVTNPGPNVFFWASYDFMFSSSDVYSHTGKSNSYASGDTSYCTIDSHTYVHEMGHVLGLEDYYDYSGQYNPAGGFSMQDYNVGCHDPYSAMGYGYVDPYIPTETMDIEIGDFQSTKDIILLTPSWNSNDSPFDEYLLIELYTNTGLNKFDCDHKYYGSPQGPSTYGIRLWHVDARLTKYSSGSYSSTLYTAPTGSNKYTHAMANTYYENGSDDTGQASPLGSSYSDYNLLQLIRNNTSTTYRPTDNLSSSSLFKQGNTFSMSSFNKQFVKGTNLNSGVALGWTFTVKSLSSTKAVITVTKV